MSGKPEPLVELKHLSCMLAGKNILDDLSVQIEKASLAVVVGLSGSGKTVLGKIITGELQPSKGSISYLYDVKENMGWVSQQHDFREWVEGGTYYQQRYDNTFGTDMPRVGHFFGEKLNEDDFFREILSVLRIDYLKDKLFLELSNGESKRVQLAFTLLRKPVLLILDNPFVGLDKETRAVLYDILKLLSQRGMGILLLCGLTDLPEMADRYYLLENGKLHRRTSAEELLKEVNEKIGKLNIISEIKSFFPAESELFGEQYSFDNAVEMQNVCVRYGDKVILQDINWTVKKGERWALIGPNGSGKSTLLSLINGDNPKAYTNHVLVFDKQRGSGESIWELKSKIGYVSPELHLFFRRSSSFTEVLVRTERRAVPGLRKTVFTCLDCITSGFHEQIGWSGTVTSHQRKLAMQWMEAFQIQDLEEQAFSTVSLGMQRVVLLARALVKNPPLLILDEPCQGLDEIQIERFRHIVDMVCTSFGKTLIYVAHYEHHIPSCVTRRFNLTL